MGISLSEMRALTDRDNLLVIREGALVTLPMIEATSYNIMIEAHNLLKNLEGKMHLDLPWFSPNLGSQTKEIPSSKNEIEIGLRLTKRRPSKQLKLFQKCTVLASAIPCFSWVEMFKYNLSLFARFISGQTHTLVLWLHKTI